MMLISNAKTMLKQEREVRLLAPARELRSVAEADIGNHSHACAAQKANEFLQRFLCEPYREYRRHRKLSAGLVSKQAWLVRLEFRATGRYQLAGVHYVIDLNSPANQ